MASKRGAIPVGLAVGGGTGPELASVFERALSRLGEAHGARFEIVRDNRRYRTFFEVAELSAAAAARAAAQDAAAYEAFLLGLARRGVQAAFRTAFNAQTIYAVREQLRAVKIEALSFKHGSFLLVRDQAQGFYAGTNDDPESSPDSLTRTCVFRRDITEKVLARALEEAAQHWGADAKPDRIFAVYKFHLLDNRFARWVQAFSKARKLRIELFQPDTMNRLLLRGGLKGRLLAIGSNEWLDIAHAELLARYGGLVQDERCARNAYLDERVEGVAEFQTVHGSADDIAGKDAVNPVATLRAAAAVAQRSGACPGAVDAMERAIENARAREGTERTAARVLSSYKPGKSRSKAGV
jgi:isocitrate/isopropylmalate dehydrogenase